ncbi:hypothetical protein METBIDRAFT_43565 [Metschnikowia bicuspidata var. bicuspidata NRRL YB-4993]|uniref:Putative lipoate-protein ligase A n=1 Tax=Metschnikowia bicuspidata var. bicuspidata NRRL YB-4993 TaxID=869754 RepID=A0A1A0H8M6_9ASCO|nr:hypothetical protein METBIDRAFT_43565 [Metschnikowia bicuspidata var. bicuspidata NRRL YB-4993]OBA20469.1 hypothetical protein METBIDRAFT_43565 [Metschnikowia bicuspidata var. bicuspidata NRRL YB-4993]
MFVRLLHAQPKCTRPPSQTWLLQRRFHSVPFQDNLTPADDDAFGLADFQHYQEAPDVRALREQQGMSWPLRPSAWPRGFEQLCTAREPVVFVSRLSDPYVNLAIEDYVYSRMPLAPGSCGNRLMFYVNGACVVVGKNQNPWREVNMPALSNLRIPLVRRRSGGGAVVHDVGNVNYSFMTRKELFDRFSFARLVAQAVTAAGGPEHALAVNDRGDIVTAATREKVSGSAYKLSRGKSYHHGTMLLSLRLGVLRLLLHRDESALGHVHAPSAVASVRSPVANVGMARDDFIRCVTRAFQDKYGCVAGRPAAEDTDPAAFDQTELLGLQGFVDAYSARECPVFTIDESVALPHEVVATADELRLWQWRFGATPRFLHRFHHRERGVCVTLDIEKKAVVAAVAVEGPPDAHHAFQFLKDVVARGDHIQYTGSNVAGFVVDDELSEWLGNAIDGTT